MGMAAILVNGPATILATFHFPAPKRLQMKFEQHWPRGEAIWNSHLFFFPYKYIGKQTWPGCKKVKCQSIYDHYFSYFGRPTVPDNLCQDSAQGILGPGEETAF